MSNSVVTDITARKQVEDALCKSEEKYRTLFESIDEGFCIVFKPYTREKLLFHLNQAIVAESARE